MWCEVVMVPTVYGPAAAAAATGATAATPTAGAATTPAAAAAAAAASSYAAFPSVPAVTGVPLNKVALATGLSAAAQQKLDTSKHFHIFVGDLAPEIETPHLREAFSVFGIVTECKIIKDMHTQKPKGYGFVAYATKDEAEEAMQKMNGQMLGSRTIRTNWAVRRPPQPPDQKPLNYDEVSAAASASNCTVYVGGITRGLCDELLREAFKDFGDILEVRLFKEKGYAFVRFDCHDSATRAIITMHGKEVGGQPCKCSWGKESNDNKDGAQVRAVSLTSPQESQLLHDEALVTTPFGFYNQLAYPYNQTASALSYLQSPQLNYAATNFAATAAANYQNRAAAAANALLSNYTLTGGSPAASVVGQASALSAFSGASTPVVQAVTQAGFQQA